MIKGFNHITFSVSNLTVSVAFYQQVFGAELLLHEDRTAYLDISGLWLALNVQADIPRQEILHSYTHIAFTIDAADMGEMEQRLQGLNIPLRPDRIREEGEGISLYFTDPDGHLLEVHCGDLASRVSAYERLRLGNH